MLIFLLYTSLFWFAGASFAWLFWASTRPEQVLDVIFKWQNMLAYLFGKGGYPRLLAKGIGDCELCTANAMGIVWFFAYRVFMVGSVDLWIPSSSAGMAIAVNIVWFLFYTSVQWNLNRWFITGKFLGGK